jgi:hypothetical protein
MVFALFALVGGALAACSSSPPSCAATACTPENLCHVGAEACGATTCVDTGANVEAGTGCGVNKFCTTEGACGDCTLGEVCTAGIAACHTGGAACSTGVAVCTDSGYVADGTACTDGAVSGYCAAGTCTACMSSGQACGMGGQCDAAGQCMLTVSGSARITYWLEGGGSTDVGNCFGQQVEVFTPTAGGGYTLLTPTSGVCTATNGTFTIPVSVPAGVYLLHFAGTAAYGNYYVETTQPTLDFGRDQAGRPDANLVANASTLVTFDSSGLRGWTPVSDTLNMVCGNVAMDLAIAGSAYGLTNFASGATTGSAVIDWKGQPLVDYAKGDVAWLYQLTSNATSAPAVPYLTVAAAGEIASLDITGLVPVTGATALEPVTASASIPITWATTQFEQLVTASNPGYTGGAHFLSVDAVQAPVIARGYVPASARVELMAMTAQPGQADLALGVLTYGRFLAPPWTEVLSTKFETHAVYTAPGATSSATSFLGIYQQQTLPLPAGASVTPVLGPPLRPLVGGLDATIVQAGVGTTAELSWLAPTTGTPDFYDVVLNEVVLDADGASTDVNPIASFLTARLRTVLPPGVLVAGHTYFAVIAALKTPVVSYDSAPLRLGLATVRAETGTASFTP